MRSHAKASSVGSTSGRGNSLDLVRRAFATRDTSSDADGSGARSRGRATLFAFALAALALLAFAPLSQAKLVVNGFGFNSLTDENPTADLPLSDLGGQFASTNSPSSPRGVAINSSGNGAPAGTSYVVDGGGNRIQRFNPKGGFDLAWGENVSGRDEIQSISINPAFLTNNKGADLGSIKLKFGGQTTGPIDVTTSLESGQVRVNSLAAKLAELPSIGGASNLTVGNGKDIVDILGFTLKATLKIRFRGSLGGTDLPQLVLDTSDLSGVAMSTSTLENGAGGSFAGFEKCTVAALCKAADNGGGTTANGGQLDRPEGVAVNQANGHVYVTESGNRRVSEFDADGNFVRTWGWDVIASGQPNDTGTGFEICEVAAECQQGSSGADGGQFGFSDGFPAIGYPVVDSSGDVWIPDVQNNRIQEFDSTGHFIAAYGYDVDALGGGGELEKCTSTAAGACQAGTSGSGAGQFSSGSPIQIAFDSSGNLFAIDSGNERVQKFNSTLTAATDFGTSVFYDTVPDPKGGSALNTLPGSLASLAGGTRLAFGVKRVAGFDDSNPPQPPQPQYEAQIIELDPTDASVKDTSLAGAGLKVTFGDPYPLVSILGLAANDFAATIYATTNIEDSPRGVLVLGDTPPVSPELAIESISNTTDTTATFEATVNPKGGMVNCKFQYSADQVNWTDVPEPDCDSLSPGGVQTVSQVVSGLTPNTHYFVRLQASRTLLSNSSVTSAVKTFDTVSVSPVVTDIGAVQVADASARMVGTIDPRHSATGYVFEYGTTPALGSSTAPLAIGSGTSPITVSQRVGGLSKDTTYYYKLVATNAFGSTTSDQETLHTRTEPFPPANPGSCPNQTRRVEQGSTFLPDCRAYEMVSPPDKNQGSATGSTLRFTSVAFAGDGEGAAFCSNALFGKPPAQQSFNCAQYLARRGPGGWTSEDPFPHYCPFGFEGNGISFNVFLPTETFDRAAVEVPEFESACAPIDPSAPKSSRNLYREDLTTDPFNFDLLSPNKNGGFEGGIAAAQVGGGSDDFSHVVYGSLTNQTADSPLPPEGFEKLYDWEEEGHGTCSTPGGCLSLLSVDPSGNPFTTASKLPAFNYGVADVPDPSAISADGDRIYFSNTTLNTQFAVRQCNEVTCDLYMRENASTTFHVSASECTIACGTDSSPDRFVWANPAGDVALFLSCTKLTDASSASVPGSFSAGGCENTIGAEQSAKLYRWDRNGAPGHRLVDLTVDHEPADGAQPHALDLIGASDDGNTVYLVAAGQLVSGAPTGKIDGTSLKLYRWSWNGGSPTLDYLAPYRSTTADGIVNDNDLVDDPNADRYHVHVTPNGKYLLIQTALALDPAADRDTDTDLYRWDEKDGWGCVSCQLPGVPSAGNVSSFETILIFNSLQREYGSVGPEHTISDDGQRIFFSTPDALVPEDVNGDTSCPIVRHSVEGVVYSCTDIYEWHDGTVSLLTSGTGANPFMLVGATRTGRDVFFATSQRMVGWDADNGVDVYDVRSGGGFPEPPAQPAICEGEACRGQGTSAPTATGAGTAVFEGQGNPTPKHQKALKHKKRHRKHQRANHNRRAGR